MIRSEQTRKIHELHERVVKAAVYLATEPNGTGFISHIALAKAKEEFTKYLLGLTHDK